MKTKLMVLTMAGALSILSACGGSSSSGSSGFCDEVKKVNADDSFGTAFDGGTPDPAAMDKAVKALKSLEGKAPAEIKKDLTAAREIFDSSEMRKVMEMVSKGADKLTPEDLEEMTSIMKTLEPKMESVGDFGTKIDEYSLKECGVKLGS
jgi:hypothetical protein